MGFSLLGLLAAFTARPSELFTISIKSHFRSSTDFLNSLMLSLMAGISVLIESVGGDAEVQEQEQGIVGVVVVDEEAVNSWVSGTIAKNP